VVIAYLALLSQHSTEESEENSDTLSHENISYRVGKVKLFFYLINYD
jgi:hypothetical protein